MNRIGFAFRADLPGHCLNSSLYCYDSIHNKSSNSSIQYLNFVKVKNTPRLSYEYTTVYAGSFVVAGNGSQSWDKGSEFEAFLHLMSVFYHICSRDDLCL